MNAPFQPAFVDALYAITEGNPFFVEEMLKSLTTRAEALLDAVLNQDAPAETLAQRLIWRARAELALARKDYAAALQIVDQLIELRPISRPAA